MNSSEYVAGALRTEAPVTPEMVARFVNPALVVQLVSTIQRIIHQGNEMDKLKKHLFYAKPLIATPSQNVATVAPEVAMRLSEGGTIRLFHAAIGLITEGTELLEILQAHVLDGTPLDDIHLIEEGGDHFWYLAILSDVLSATFEDMMERNNRKLTARYAGQRYHQSAALTRDLGAERRELEGK